MVPENEYKTVTSVFHLDNQRANQTLKIRIGSKLLPAERNRKYLGLTLDRTLTYSKHTENVAQKLKIRNSILELTGTTWGLHQTTLRTYYSHTLWLEKCMEYQMIIISVLLEFVT